MITCKSPHEIAKMRASGRVTAQALAVLVDAAKPGVTTKAIDAIAERTIRSQGGEPAFLGYQGFTGSVCLSVNDEVVHGIPGGKTLRDGDLLKIDIGSLVDGWYSDMACTVPVGTISAEARRLLEVTEEALHEGISQVRPGVHVSDIGHAVQEYVEKRGFSVVRALVGHGIGSRLHEEPPVPNFGRKGTGVVLKPGMVLAIEPMVNAGTWEVRTKTDGWTVVTADGRLSAHFEHTVAVQPDGFEVLTVAGDAASINRLPERYSGSKTGGSLGANETRRRAQAG
ncbi:MAG TPA: type I methionyl aminopeptidase [Candidatus Eremiobacteraceae bacterium]|nr:type I methionyl aminopeptidase [Candidatus Eremiobacteraceae bacterium]